MAENLSLRLNITGNGDQLVATLRDAEGRVSRFSNQSRSSIDRINDSARRLSNQISSTTQLAVGLLGINIGGNAANSLVRDIAAYQDLQTRLKSLIPNAKEFGSVSEYIQRVAQEQHKDISLLSQSYARLRNLQNAGLLTNQQTKAIFEGMNNAATALGATNDQLGQSYYGLAQGLSQGTVRAEEFNQILEPLPGLMQRLDDALGNGAGGMRRLVNEGKLTSDMFANYLVVALKSYDGAAAAAGKNLNANFTDVRNSYQGVVAALESPVSMALLPVLKDLTDYIKNEATPALNDFAKIDFKGIGDDVGVGLGALAGARVGGVYGAPVGALAAYLYGQKAGDMPNLTANPNDSAEDLRRKIAKAQDYAKDVYGSIFLSGEEQQAILKKVEAKKQALLAQLMQVNNAASAPAAAVEKAISKIDLYRQAEQRYQLPANLVQAVANVESSGNQNALSPKGAVGIMQIVPSAHPELDLNRLKTDQAYNIDKGAAYLAELNKIFNGDLPAVIAAYNAGQGRVKKSLSTSGLLPQNAETQAYVLKVLKELDELNKGKVAGIADAFKLRVATAESQLDAASIRIESGIESRAKQAQSLFDVSSETLKIAKEQGKLSIAAYYQALTDEQQKLALSQIDVIKARIIELNRQQGVAVEAAKPEQLPAINAGFDAKKAALNADLSALQAKLKLIEPANIIDRDKELLELSDVVNQVKAKIADLRGVTNADPVVIRATLQLKNADIIRKLNQADQGGLANQYLDLLTASEQAQVLEQSIARSQQETQAQETRVNLLQQAGSITKLSAQQQLRDLYAQQATELEGLADRLTTLGQNSGLEELKIKAVDAQNAAQQLRLTVPTLQSQFIDAGQTAGVSAMSDALVNLSSGAQDAGDAFQQMSLSIVQSLQRVAAQKASEAIFGMIFNLAGSALSGGLGGLAGSASSGINAGNTSISSALNNFIPARAEGGLIDLPGGLIRGPGTGTSDSIAAAVKPGSFIVKAKSTHQIGAERLNALIKGHQSAIGGIPALVSNTEFNVPPDMVKKYGVGFWQHVNQYAEIPPMSIQRAYAGGGVVGSAPNSVGDGVAGAVSIDMGGIHINQAADAGKPDLSRLQGMSQAIKGAVREIIMEEMRPGGALRGGR